MTDIAPLGFGIDTSGLERGKRAAADFAASLGLTANAADKAAAAHLRGLKAEKDAAEATARHANAKVALLKITEGTSAATLKEAQAVAASANAAATATKAKLELATAEQQVNKGMQDVAKSGNVAAGVMQGVAREAAAMASTMGIGGMGGRLGVAGALGAAQGAAQRLTPQLNLLSSVQGKVAVGATALVIGYTALSASLADNQDRWASYQQQLVNTLGGQGAAQKSLYEVVNLANEVGISVDAALMSFNRFARAKEDIGATNEELLLMTETIMKLGRSSGVEAGAMQGAMMQLSQALASGRLNGDELRSIMENMQPLAKAIADGLGVSVGQLKRMGAEGELTSDKIFRSLLSQAGKAEDAFRSMPKTVEQSKTRMANQFDELAAHLGRLTGASEWMRRNIDFISKPMEMLNTAFRAFQNDAMAQTESNLAKLERRHQQLTAKTSFMEEFNKSFNKDEAKAIELEKKRSEASEKRAKEAQALIAATANLQIATARVEGSSADIAALQALGQRSPAFRKSADQRIGALGATDMKEWAEKVKESAVKVRQLSTGVNELDRQLEQLKFNDPFEKLSRDAADLEKALAGSALGAIDLNLQAQEIARATGKSVEQVMTALTRLEGLRAERTIRETLRDAGSQRAMATAIAGGGDRMAAEAAAEATERFGDTMGRNSDIVKRYTSALYDMKQAMQAVADATELTRLKTQLEELAGVIGVLQGGGGSYAERLSRHQSGIAAFQAERVGVGTTAPAAAGGRGATPGLVGDLLRSAFGGTITSTTGGKHVAGSYHYKNQAVDFVPGGGMRGASKEQIRALMAANGISILELLGPGDKGHSDHFHVAFGKGGAAGATAPGATNYTGQIVGQRNALFNTGEQERALRMVSGLRNQSSANVEMITALQSGSPEAVRLAELQLKVIAAQQDFAPEYADMVENAIRDADAVDRKLKAEQQIFDLRAANDNQSRRNAAVATGDPAQIKALELQLRIEEIRRTTPADKQQRMIDEAVRGDALQQAEAAARMTGEFANQKRQVEEQFKIIGLIGEEERIQIKLLETRNQLFMAGIPLNGEIAAGLLQQAEIIERMNIALEQQRERWDFIRSSNRQLFEEMGRAGSEFFGTLMRTGDAKWKTLIGGMEEAFYAALDRMVEKFVISPLINVLTNAVSGFMGNLFGGPAPGMNSEVAAASAGGYSALGNVYNSRSGFVPFAGGDIFSAPTRFGFGKGRQGLAGEGPGVYEAIMPLKRGPDGRLGVAGGGGGGGGSTQVNIFDQRSAANSEAVEIQEREIGDGNRTISVTIRDTVKEHMRKGAFDADQRQAYGTQRQVVRR